nr:DUF1460 domain-containing protein [bacterium]
SEFKESLLTVRYRAGEISYQNRKHFFTDWINYNSASVVDCTELLGQGRAVCAEKILNNKDDGSLYLQGVPCVQRDVVYIPSKDIDKTVLQSLRTGDYIGVYSELPGLDVSHVGIFIKNGEASYLRHASRRQGKVIDEDFMSYIKNTPGIVVLRPEGE